MERDHKDDLAWVADARLAFRRAAMARPLEAPPKRQAGVVTAPVDPLAGVEGLDRKKLRQALMIEPARASGFCHCAECCSEQHTVELWTGTETKRMALHWPGEVPCGECNGDPAWDGVDCECCAGLGYVRCQGW